MLYDPERRWVNDGACRGEDPDLFFTSGTVPPRRSSGDGAIQAAWDEAKKVCHRCPVLEECRRDTLGEDFGVFGGRDERQRYLIRGRLRDKAKKWPPELRLAWGKEFQALRKQGVSWSSIRVMTGFPERLCHELIVEWASHCYAEAQRAAQVVVDLPLPESAVPDPPAAPGRKHAWVRHSGVWADAHYRGETADGAWVLVQLKAGKGASMKWIRAESVRIYYPQPAEILEYVGRPGREEPAQKAG